jgi:RHS repeat-associated protein
LLQSETTGSTTALFAWNTGAKLPLLLTDGTNAYLYGPGATPVEQVNIAQASAGAGASSANFLLGDVQGSVRTQFSASGTLLGTISFDANGNRVPGVGTMTTPVGYTGAWRDAASGLEYLRARWYDPTTAQFTSVDPLVAKTGQAYEYAGDNPVDNSDPTGLCWGGATLCSIENSVSSALGTVGDLAGAVQIAADTVTVVCVLGCEEVWIVSVPVAKAAGAVATAASCGSALLGKNVDPCVESIIVYNASMGFGSDSAGSDLASALQDLWSWMVENGASSSGGPSASSNQCAKS